MIKLEIKELLADSEYENFIKRLTSTTIPDGSTLK